MLQQLCAKAVVHEGTLFEGADGSVDVNVDTKTSPTAADFTKESPKKRQARSTTRKNRRLRKQKMTRESLDAVIADEEVTILCRSGKDSISSLIDILRLYSSTTPFLSSLLSASVLSQFSHHIEPKWKEKLQDATFDNNCVCYALLMLFPDILILKLMTDKIHGVLTASKIFSAYE